MPILALLLVVVVCLYGEAHLLMSLQTMAFTPLTVPLHLILAASATGLVWAAGSQIDRRVAATIADIMADPATALARPVPHARGLAPLALMLLPLLVYLVSLAFVGALAGALGAAWLIGQAGRVPMALALAVLGVAGGAVIASLVLLYHLLFPARAEAAGGGLAKDRHPRLWALSQEVASSVGTRPVDRIAITPLPGIGVYEAGGLLTRLAGRGQRILLLGLPSLHELTERQFAAILAHEYGHFRGGDTRWSALIGYLERALRATLAATPGPGSAGGLTGWLMAFSPAYWVLRLYVEVFFRATGSLSRLQEVLADLAAIRFAGGPALRTALLTVGMNDQLYVEALERHYGSALRQGASAASDPVALLALAREQTPKALLKKFETNLLDPANSAPYDSHPPMRLRLDYAERAPDVPDGSDTPAISLFDAWDEITAYAMGELNHALTDD